MSANPLPESQHLDSNGNPEERRKERDIGHAIFVIIGLAKSINWGKFWIGVLILLTLTNHQGAKDLLSGMPGFGFLKKPPTEESTISGPVVSYQMTRLVRIENDIQGLKKDGKELKATINKIAKALEVE